jgi:hypothetical protein
MILRAEVVPRHDAAPDQLKRLGAVLRDWSARTLGELAAAHPDADGWIDTDALDDLAAGELPHPALLRLVGGGPGLALRDVTAAVERARATSPLARKVIPAPVARSVSFGLSASGDVCARAVDALRHALQPLGVADVVVNDGE